MSSLIGIFALGALSLLIVLWPLWQRRSDRSLGSGIETDDISLQWEQEKDRLVKEQHDLDFALAENKISATEHKIERELVVSDAKHALERLRLARGAQEKMTSASLHKPRAYPKFGAAFALTILLSAMGLTMFLKGQDIQRAAKVPGKQQVTMADIKKMVSRLEAKVKAGEGSLKDKLMLARSFIVLEKRGAAVSAYENILSESPKNIPAIMALGELYFNSKDSAEWPKALAYFDKALVVEPDKPEALWYKSLSLVKGRKLDEARVVLVHLRDVSKDNAKAQSAVTKLLAELDKNRAPPSRPDTKDDPPGADPPE